MKAHLVQRLTFNFNIGSKDLDRVAAAAIGDQYRVK